MHEALYGVDGFYSSGRGQPGRRGDFITSPEVGPLFGAVIARALDMWWHELSSPRQFDVIEVGAGTGSLRRSVLRAGPECLAALRYSVVEIGPYAPTDALRELPSVPITGVILCNELLDNLPIDLAIDDAVIEASVDTAAGPASWPEVGLRPAQQAAHDFVTDSLEHLDGGRLVAIDYCGTNFAERPWSEWLRTYRGHERGSHPLDGPGTKDITCEVDVSQLPAPSSNLSQAEFLRRHGIDELVEQGRRVWHERAHLGDLEALKARSRITEAEALCDPSGLGSFRVLEWLVS